MEVDEHFTDTGGASDHVFALFALIGKRFAPRLRNIKDRKFHAFEKGDVYPGIENHIGAPINTALILDHWDDLLRLAASVTLDDPQEVFGFLEIEQPSQSTTRNRPH